MNVALLAIRLVLALVLAVAGVAKLADRDGAREAAIGFGLPEGLAPAVAALLPLVELGAAILLIPRATEPAGAALALVLVAAFSIAIARSIARGEAPDCHCFGALHSEPAGPRTLIRNLALAGAAVVALAGGPGSSATGWLGRLTAGWLAALVLAVALVAAVAWVTSFVLRLLRRHGELLLRIDTLEGALAADGLRVPSSAVGAGGAGLPVGSVAPEFELDSLAGERVGLNALRAAFCGERLLLVFTDPGCGPCTTLLPQVGTWQRERPGGLRPVLISRGAPEANLGHAREHGLTDVLLQRDREVSESFRAPATPSALIVAADGTIASGVHAGEEQIRALVAGRSEVALPVHHHVPAGESPAPDPQLRTLAGEPLRLSAVVPADGATIVFWNPACGFCERMLDDLRALDAAAAGGLVVVSTGDPEANRAMALRAPVLLDDSFAAGNAFGADGTPSAVRIDRRGRVASPVATGADAVLALAGTGPEARAVVRADGSAGADVRASVGADARDAAVAPRTRVAA